MGILPDAMKRASLGKTTEASDLPDRVVVINDISSPRGGATSVALTSAIALAKLGIAVTFIAGDDASEIQPEHRSIDFAAIGNAHILDGSRVDAAIRGVYSGKAAAFVADWIGRHDTPRTVYHLHGWSKLLSPSVFRPLQSVASRLAVHAHDHFLVCPNGGFFHYANGTPCSLRPMSAACIGTNCDRRSYAQKMWRTTRQVMVGALFDASRVGMVLPVHSGMMPLLERGGIPRDRMTPLRNPVRAWRATRVNAGNNRIFLYVGRIDADKGVERLAEASRLAGIRLRMIGEGPLRKALEARYQEIEFCGWRSRTEIEELCRDARMLVMPSMCRETFGLAVFEALQSGIPVAVSVHVMASREIEEAGIGVTVEPSDVVGFASALRRASEDEALIDAMSRRSFGVASSLAPTEAQWCDELLDVYRIILARQAPTESLHQSPFR